MSTADNIELLRRETSLPGLALVLDPMQVQELLRARAAISSTEHVELVYIRYKPGRRALSLMQVVDSSGRQRPLVVNACDTTGWDKLLSLKSGDERAQSWLIPGLKSSLDWFPVDRRLRSAAKLFEPTKTAKVLHRMTGTTMSEPWALAMLAYKPHRRLVVKASSGSTAVVLKCYTAADYAHAQQQIDHVAQARIDGCSPNVVGVSDRYSIVASAWIEGEVLSSDLNASSNWQDQFPKVGSLLARWHREGRRRLPMITRQHTAFTHAALNQLAADIVWLMPEIKKPLAELLIKLEGAIDTFACASDLIHGDFYAKQIIVQRENLHLIDFDEVGRGHRLQDLGTFVGKLYWNAVRDGADVKPVKPATEAFLSGYEQEAEEVDEPLFQASVVAGILRSMPHAFRRGLPNWREKMMRMFELALEWCPTNRMKAGHFKQPATSDVRAEVRYDHSESAPYLDVDRINAQLRRQGTLADSIVGAQVVRAHLLRYKPGKRLLIEYSLQHNHGAITQVVGKARLKKSVDQRVIQLHNDLQVMPSAVVRVPQVLGALPELNLWLQEKICGEPVHPESSASNHRAVGLGLAELHESSLSIGRSHTVDDELAILREQFTRWLLPVNQFAMQSERLLQACYSLAGHLALVDTTLIHRDFYFDQVLSLEGGVALLDFDLAAMGPPELDVGNYLAHLDEFAIRNDCQPACERSSQAFLGGYIDRRPCLQLANVDIWRRLSLARLVAISQRIHERSHTTSALLNACQSPVKPTELGRARLLPSLSRQCLT